ncbi:MAG TPA: glycosyltransferase family 1 protein [Chloroflexia bacterium]|nr:glycosyltransferase family 1 protein [Chloroflexia bacterium]
MNGYFWGQPRTGSGQYIRHLWSALQSLSDSTSNGSASPDLLMLLPPGAPLDEPVPIGPTSAVVPSPNNRLATLNADLGKLLWEEWGVARQARKHRVDLLHTPYLTAPLPILDFGFWILDFMRKRSRANRRHVDSIQNPKSKIQNPQVVTAHDMIPWVVPGYGGSPFFKLYLALATAGVKRATAIMADSEASRRDVIRILRMPPGRVHTVYLGVEAAPQYTEAQLDEVRARFGLPRRYAFYLGGFDRRKNVPLLLRAWRNALASLHSPADAASGERPLLAVGGVVPEPGGVFPDVRGEANSLGMEVPDAPVRFMGRISESDKPLLMAAAHLFVYPSSYEGFGLDPLEAMSVGCPVISSSGGSLIEVVGDGGILVPPDDERALCEAIVQAWHDPDLRANLSQRGRSQASQFTWERTARQTLDVYTRALKSARSRQ